MKIGLGYDVHRLVENRKLIIGGEEIAYSKGLLGHSDADVLIHAIMDSLLGAAGLGDIGKFFPDTDDNFKDVSSLILLEKVRDILGRKNHSIINIDTTIVAQEPKLSPYIDKMIKNIATSLKISTSQINIKATTEEGLGFTGTKEGIAAYSICLIS